MHLFPLLFYSKCNFAIFIPKQQLPWKLCQNFCVFFFEVWSSVLQYVRIHEIDLLLHIGFSIILVIIHPDSFLHYDNSSIWCPTAPDSKPSLLQALTSQILRHLLFQEFTPNRLVNAIKNDGFSSFSISFFFTSIL